MALVKADRVKETSTTTGTGALTLGGAMTGYRAFSSVCATNDTVWYALQAVDGSGVPTGDWEVGLGTYSGTNTLTRTTVYSSSNSNNAVNLAAGTKQVWIGLPASQVGGLNPFVGSLDPNKPTTTGLTVTANSTATASASNLSSGRGFVLTNQRASTSLDSMAHVGKSVTGNWTLTAFVNTNLVLAADYSHYGLFCIDSAGKTVRWGPAGTNITAYPGWSYDKWSGFPSSPAYVGRSVINGHSTNGGPIWLRLQYTSGSNFVFSSSVDGETWSVRHSVSATDYIGSPSSAGIFINCNFGSTGDSAYITCYHFDIA